MDKKLYIESVEPIELGGQMYEFSQTELIGSTDKETTFNYETNYIEYHIYNGNKFLIDTENNLISYKVYDNQVYINPEEDLKSRTYQPGQYYTLYNFLNPILSSSVQDTYYIAEISANRTELRLATVDIKVEDVIQSVNKFKNLLETSNDYQDFYLNLGNNNLLIANNIQLDYTNDNLPTVLIKLYEPLPLEVTVNTQCWAVMKVAESKAYSLNIEITFSDQDTTIRLKGPNTNLNIQNRSGKSNEYVSITSLTDTSENNLKNQLSNILTETGVDLNIDYADYNNFVFFSNAQSRLENFYYKLTQLEGYEYNANLSTETVQGYNSTSIEHWQTKITELIDTFDGYEYYLYFESGSQTWPKISSTPPYQNYPTTSSQAINWLQSQLTVAQTYDDSNKDKLTGTIPSYIQDDPDSINYKLFIEMAGQHYDSIWLYIKAVTQKYNTNSNINQGLSKELLGKALEDFGIKLYSNNFTNINLYNSFLGITPSGSLLPNTGNELINTYITASNTSSLIPLENLPVEIYKRLYHNIPLLYKKKGTLAGLRLLQTIYGVPETILEINEFGRKDKHNETWDTWQQNFDYYINTGGTNVVTSSFELHTDWNAVDNKPSAVEFRFKTPGIPTTINLSQSLWGTDKNIAVRLRYDQTILDTGSYSGSVINPYYQYGYLELFPDITDLNSSASIYLPFFNRDWWTVLVNKQNNSTYTLHAGNNTYNLNNSSKIGFSLSDTVSKVGNWSGSIKSYLASSSLSDPIFSGSLQELRYYTNVISQSTFEEHVMNPNSIQGNTVNSSPNELAFRAAIGGELYTQSISCHPKVSGQWTTTASFTSGNDFKYINTPVFKNNKTTVFLNEPTVGIKNKVTKKVNVENVNVYGTVVSTLQSLQQNPVISQSFTPNVNYIEVGYSPQNEINRDIANSIGNFNIGEYIGDPRQISASNTSYPNLDRVRDNYFNKYTTPYNYQDYFRLIKFYDNSLFNLIKDFIPVKVTAATGAIVKQHLLERNKQKATAVTYVEPYYTGSVTSLLRNYTTGSLELITGGPGGVTDIWTELSQSTVRIIETPLGLVNQTETSHYEFYNGDYSGSNIECKLSHSLNSTVLLNNISSSRLSTILEDVDYNTDALNPTNLALIQSGSAYKAAVQDSNYSKDTVWRRGRYDGSKNTGAYNTNILLPSSSIAPGYPIDKFTSYFAYFDWVGGANPLYPGGGNTHITRLINAETGDIITLSEQNKYIETVSQIYKAGNEVYILPFSASTSTSVFSTKIIEGGALYKTIVLATGSQEPFIISDTDRGLNQSFQITFNTSSLNTFTDSGSVVSGNSSWIYSLTNPSSSAGIIDIFYFTSYKGVSIFNKVTGEYISSESIINDGIKYTDTYFPLNKGDFIRFGTTSSFESASLDGSFTAGGLFQIKKITTGSDNNVTSSMEVTPSIAQYSFTQNTALTNINNQNFRIFRRIPNETFILTETIPYRGDGLLIPNNLNPKYNPIEIAKRIGII